MIRRLAERRVVLLAGAVVALIAVALRPGSRGARRVRRAAHVAGRRGRHLRGRARGWAYRLARRRPDEDVSDLVLADRIRSGLGPLEQRLDLPRIHVMVQDGIATLHGDVATSEDRTVLEDAVAATSGVRGVESHLHVGLLPGDTRPSQGRAVQATSAARRRLEHATQQALESDDGTAVDTLAAVLSAFCGRLPEVEREQLLAHLPEDVRTLTEPSLRDTRQLRTADDLVARVAAAVPGVGSLRARPAVSAVLRELASLVPEEGDDIAAVLPRALAEFWDRARHEPADQVEVDRA